MNFATHLVPAQPEAAPSDSFDARDWRLRYFRTVGSVCRYRDTDSLALCVADRVDAYDGLRAELDASPGNVNAVLLECDAAKRAMESAFSGRRNVTT